MRRRKRGGTRGWRKNINELECNEKSYNQAEIDMGGDEGKKRRTGRKVFTAFSNASLLHRISLAFVIMQIESLCHKCNEIGFQGGRVPFYDLYMNIGIWKRTGGG